LLAAGCGGSRVAHGPAGVPGTITHAAPRGYHVENVWHADLSGHHVLDAVVSSAGPHRVFGGLPGRSTDLRVLEWKPDAHRWEVTFDAQNVVPSTPCTPASSPSPCYPYLGGSGLPLLDPHNAETLGPVRFAHLVSRRRNDLVFSEVSASGSAQPTTVAVVDFDGGYPSLDYTWGDAHGLRWSVAHRRIYDRAGYYTPTDAECCPVRMYRFSVAARDRDFVETSDNRPWLGVTVRGSRVIGISPDSPAARALRVGDVLLGVVNPRRLTRHHLDDEIGALHAGQTARLRVERDGRKLIVRVRLGSLKDLIPALLPANDWRLADL
jgi:PDZ domain-containing protein